MSKKQPRGIFYGKIIHIERMKTNPTKPSIVQGAHSAGGVLTPHLVDRVGVRLSIILEVYH